MKKFIAVLMALLMVVSFAACGGNDDSDLEAYEFDGLTIKMEKGMEAGESEDFTVFVSSDTAMMTGVKEDFEAFEAFGYDPEAMTLDEYAALVAQANTQFGGEFEKDANGNYAVTYTSTVGETTFYYHATVVKGTNAFWVITFACYEADSDTYADQFVNWANTIVAK